MPSKLRHHILTMWLVCLQQIFEAANQIPGNPKIVLHLRCLSRNNLHRSTNVLHKYALYIMSYDLRPRPNYLELKLTKILSNSCKTQQVNACA